MTNLAVDLDLLPATAEQLDSLLGELVALRLSAPDRPWRASESRKARSLIDQAGRLVLADARQCGRPPRPVLERVKGEFWRRLDEAAQHFRDNLGDAERGPTTP